MDGEWNWDTAAFPNLNPTESTIPTFCLVAFVFLVSLLFDFTTENKDHKKASHKNWMVSKITD